MLKTAVPNMSANATIGRILNVAAGVEDDAIAEGMALALAAILHQDEIDARVVITNVRSAAIAERKARDYAILVAHCAESAVKALDEAIGDIAADHFEPYDEVAYSLAMNDVYDAVKDLLGVPEAL